MDGCCAEGDTIDFRMALRGASSQYLCPTVKNVYNKFSVRFFVRLLIFIKVRFRIKAKKQSNNDEASDGEESEEREAIEGDSDDEPTDA